MQGAAREQQFKLRGLIEESLRRNYPRDFTLLDKATRTWPRVPWMTGAILLYDLWKVKQLYDALGGGNGEPFMTNLPSGVEAFCQGVGSVQGVGISFNVGCGSDHVESEPITSLYVSPPHVPHWHDAGTRWAWYNVEDTFFDPEADPAFAYHWTVVGRWRVEQSEWPEAPPELQVGFADLPGYPQDYPQIQIDPMLYPPGQSPEFKPPPYRDLPKRKRNPHFVEQTERGPGPAVRPKPEEKPGPKGVDIPRPPDPDSPPEKPIKPKPIAPAPPGKGVHEKKVNVKRGGWYTAVRWALNAETEGLDYIDALYWALPDELRKKNHNWTPEGKWEFLMRHLGEVRVRQGLENLIMNALQDFAIGRLSKSAQRITKHPAWWRPVGPGTGPGL